MLAAIKLDLRIGGGARRRDLLWQAHQIQRQTVHGVLETHETNVEVPHLSEHDTGPPYRGAKHWRLWDGTATPSEEGPPHLSNSVTPPQVLCVNYGPRLVGSGAGTTTSKHMGQEIHDLIATPRA